MSAQLDQIKSTFDRMADAWKTNDAAAVASFFTEDGALINPFGERADGRQAIAAMYAKYFGGMLRGTTTAVDLTSVRTVEGNHVFADGKQTVYGADGNVVLALHMATLLRREGTAWRLVDARPYTYATIPV